MSNKGCKLRAAHSKKGIHIPAPLEERPPLPTLTAFKVSSPSLCVTVMPMSLFFLAHLPALERLILPCLAVDYQDANVGLS
ncbi:hypothetical protein ARMGADRAFT_1083002 [Armillaria gallica]|uniref:Uncharacterized protein n=1 Tax=Armillaria gallica TaxID=47427 RepID=A0A2H3DGZ2_ARMGA|nr:hypothetical protein ARMGADRAFT_1083002 [Armillaria gallica]